MEKLQGLSIQSLKKAKSENFCKGFEILLKKHIYNHIQGRISRNQDGFMKEGSTVTNLITITLS